MIIFGWLIHSSFLLGVSFLTMQAKRKFANASTENEETEEDLEKNKEREENPENKHPENDIPKEPHSPSCASLPASVCEDKLSPLIRLVESRFLLLWAFGLIVGLFIGWP